MIATLQQIAQPYEKALTETHAELIERLKHMARELERTAVKLQQGGVLAAVDHTGVVRDHGATIDRLCILLNAHQTSVRDLRLFIACAESIGRVTAGATNEAG